MAINVSILRAGKTLYQPTTQVWASELRLRRVHRSQCIEVLQCDYTAMKSLVLRNEVHEGTDLWDLNLSSFPTAPGQVL